MLRLWRDALRVMIAPDRLVLVRASRWRGKILEQSVIPVSDAGEPSWRGAVDALSHALKHAAWQQCDVHVVLSDRMVRYLLVPAAKDGNPAKVDSQLVANHYFKETYGGMASVWTCHVDDSDGDGKRLATAIDRDLLNNIANCCNAPGYRLVSLKPALVVAFNHFRKEWGAGPHWFAITDAHSACLCLYQGGAWVQIRSIETEEDLGAEIARVMARENLLAGIETAQGEVSILALDTLDHTAMDAQGQKVRRLGMLVSASARTDSARVALALAA